MFTTTDLIHGIFIHTLVTMIHIIDNDDKTYNYMRTVNGNQPADMFHRHLHAFDAYKVSDKSNTTAIVRFHRDQVFPHFVSSVPHHSFADQVNKALESIGDKRISYDVMSGWFTVKLIG